MRPESLRELVEREPFIPFRVQLSSGDQIEITRGHTAVVMRTELFVVLPNDHWRLIPLRHIASVETLEAA